jgi:tRNA A-37 threonylcarbamoyl transferase component Bud32
MTTCAQCGSTSPSGAVFCGSCGAQLGKQGTAPGSPIAAAAPLAPVPAKAALPSWPLPPPPPLPLAPEAGAPTPAKRGALANGTVIDGKYAIVQVLGQGGMGIVYLARDIHTGLSVVLKAVRRELAHRPDVRQRTLAEGRVLAQIDHPNVVQLKAVVVEASDLWLVMQYVEGESLDKIIGDYSSRGERMPIAEALGIFRQIVAGVGAAHEEGVIHRDLKPANVLIRRKDRTIKVTDFGIAKIPSETNREQTKGIIGSLWYMSPEQVTGRRDLDQRVDIYALGILLYQMLVGQVPFDAESDYDVMKMHAEAPMPAASAARADVPAAVDVLIQKMCSKSRDERFQSCEELLRALARVTAAAPPARTVPEAPAPEAMARGMTVVAAPVSGATTGPGSEVEGGASPAATTGQGAVIPSQAMTHAGATTRTAPGVGRVWRVVGLGAILIAVGMAISLALGWVRVRTGPRRGGRPAASQEQRPGPTPSASAEPGPGPGAAPGPGPGPAPTPGAKSPLEALEGAWVANGKELDAVLSGEVLEFRVRTPAQFEPQNYEAGEARFVLRMAPEGFTVEDRIRPLPPSGKKYDPRARNTCQEVWTTAAGAPLRARFDGTRLNVELAKIEPVGRNFVVEGERVTSCRGLRNLKAARVVNTLSRP